MKVYINDKECVASAGQTLLQVALDNGFLYTYFMS